MAPVEPFRRGHAHLVAGRRFCPFLMDSKKVRTLSRFGSFVKSSAGKVHGDMTESCPHPGEACFGHTPQ